MICFYDLKHILFSVCLRFEFCGLYIWDHLHACDTSSFPIFLQCEVGSLLEKFWIAQKWASQWNLNFHCLLLWSQVHFTKLWPASVQGWIIYLVWYILLPVNFKPASLFYSIYANERGNEKALGDLTVTIKSTNNQI